jgi:hypothetical protein
VVHAFIMFEWIGADCEGWWLGWRTRWLLAS